MPEYHVIRCSSCRTFQVQQVKKVPKWACSTCGTKQTLLKVYAISTYPKDCRLVCMNLSMAQGEEDEERDQGRLQELEDADQEEDAHPACSLGLHHGGDGAVGLSDTQPKSSRQAASWNEYVCEDRHDASSVQDEMAQDEGFLTCMEGHGAARTHCGRGQASGRRARASFSKSDQDSTRQVTAKQQKTASGHIHSAALPRQTHGGSLGEPDERLWVQQQQRLLQQQQQQRQQQRQGQLPSNYSAASTSGFGQPSTAAAAPLQPGRAQFSVKQPGRNNYMAAGREAPVAVSCWAPAACSPPPESQGKEADRARAAWAVVNEGSRSQKGPSHVQMSVLARGREVPAASKQGSAAPSKWGEFVAGDEAEPTDCDDYLEQGFVTAM